MSARTPWRIGAVMLAVLALGFVGATLLLWQDPRAILTARRVPVAVITLELGALCLVIALAMWSSRPPFEVGRGGPDAAFHPTWAIGKASAGILLLYAGFSPRMLGSRTGVWAAVPLFVIAGIGLGMLLWVTNRHWPMLRLARCLLALPVHRGALTARRWCFEAIVEATATPLAKVVEYARHTQLSTQTTRRKDGSTATRTIPRSWTVGRPTTQPPLPMRLRTAHGVLEVDARELVWGAPLAYRDVPKGQVMTHASVNSGDAVLVVGRIAGDQSRISEVMLFGAPAHARATLVRLVLGWLVKAVALSALVAGSIGLGLYLWRHAPPT
ncbi:MAG: hypothetical protein H0T79_01945 [Deltaproteobacteria bacterium]|nr:hypothetical protein [Deltaproteobacteria bacterium]